MMEIKTTDKIISEHLEGKNYKEGMINLTKEWVAVDDLISKMVSDGKGNMRMDEAVFAELAEKANGEEGQ